MLAFSILTSLPLISFLVHSAILSENQIYQHSLKHLSELAHRPWLAGAGVGESRGQGVAWTGQERREEGWGESRGEIETPREKKECREHVPDADWPPCQHQCSEDQG
jgi:hypothetical protein